MIYTRLASDSSNTGHFVGWSYAPGAAKYIRFSGFIKFENEVPTASASTSDDIGLYIHETIHNDFLSEMTSNEWYFVSKVA
jgi:hypothetical protein